MDSAPTDNEGAPRLHIHPAITTTQMTLTHLGLAPEGLLLPLLARLLVLHLGPGRRVGEQQLLQHHAQPLLLLRGAQQHPQQPCLGRQLLVALLR